MPPPRRIKIRRPAAPDVENDATPERLAHARADLIAAGGRDRPDGASVVDDVVDLSGKSAKKIGKARQMKTTRLDHLYHLGALPFSHWDAGNWWRQTAEAALGLPKVVADYGQSAGGGQRNPTLLPLSHDADLARRAMHEAKAAISLRDREAIEDLLGDDHPKLEGAAASNRTAYWRAALRALAIHLNRFPVA